VWGNGGKKKVVMNNCDYKNDSDSLILYSRKRRKSHTNKDTNLSNGINQFVRTKLSLEFKGYCVFAITISICINVRNFTPAKKKKSRLVTKQGE
jgi:hypothetical protein